MAARVKEAAGMDRDYCREVSAREFDGRTLRETDCGGHPAEGMFPSMASVTYMIDGHRVELVESETGDQWVCDCRAYRARASIEGPRCTHAWDAWLFAFIEPLQQGGGVSAPKGMQ